MGTIKSAMNEAMIFNEKSMNDFIKGIMAILQPNETYAVTTSVNAIVDAIICLLKNVFNAIAVYIPRL